MHLHCKCPAGTIKLFVTRPDGLTEEESPSNDYVVKFIEPTAAREIYSRMDVYNGQKIDHLVQYLPTGWENEVPFLQPDETTGKLVCKNDAHVLEAMTLLGVDPVPVVLHYRYGSLI
jgi:hypothetical protein